MRGSEPTTPGIGPDVQARLRAEAASFGYGPAPVVDGVSVRIADGRITTIVGPNGCGKSTLLRGLVRVLKPRGGAVYLDGRSVQMRSTKALARELGLLAQGAGLVGAVTVEELAQRGRYPHQPFFAQPTAADRAAVERALALTGMGALRQRAVDELSGGQRQRAWIAMVLAQQTPILLLDEPTTYLDIAHQQEVLALVRRLNAEDGRTVVMVLHDIGDAARISDTILAMREGAIVAEGPPAEVVTPRVLERVFGVSCDVATDGTGRPVVLPRSAAMLDAPPSPAPTGAITVDGVFAGYPGRHVLEDIRLDIPAGRITAVVGPNASGKSTLLKALARLLPVARGTIALDGRSVARIPPRRLATRLAMLSQGPAPPDGVTVEDLVAAGRYPHQRWYRQWTEADASAVEHALAAADLVSLRHRPVEQLSGGQRQRAAIATALAQDTPVLLLDEPTTFLDLAHQVEVLDLAHTLNRRHGRTVVMVLHDLTQACRYADFLVLMRDGRVVASGPPRAVATADLIGAVFGVACEVAADPRTGRPTVLTRGAADCPRQAAASPSRAPPAARAS